MLAVSQKKLNINDKFYSNWKILELEFLKDIGRLFKILLKKWDIRVLL